MIFFLRILNRIIEFSGQKNEFLNNFKIEFQNLFFILNFKFKKKKQIKRKQYRTFF